MALIVSTSSPCRGRVRVQWSSEYPAYLSHRSAAYVVTVAVASVTRDWRGDSSGTSEWIVLIRDRSTTSIQLDTTNLEQSCGSVVVQCCGYATRENFSSTFRADDQSQTRSWRVTAAADVVRHDDWQGFFSRTIRQFVPGFLVSMAHWITSAGQS